MVKRFRPLPCDREIIRAAVARLELREFLKRHEGIVWTEQSTLRLEELAKEAGTKGAANEP